MMININTNENVRSLTKTGKPFFYFAIMFLIEEGEEDEGNIVDSRLLGSAASMPSVYTKPAPSNCIVSNLIKSGPSGPFV